MKNLDAVATQQYIDKADHFFQAMRLLAMDLPSYRTGIALLAVHSVISLNDAIVTGMTGKRRNRQDHQIAVTELEKIARRHRVGNMKGIDHFRWLVTEKSKIAYGRRRLDDAVVRMSIDRAEKFYAWAYNSFKEILRDSAGA